MRFDSQLALFYQKIWYAYWRKGMEKVLANYGFEHIDTPFLEYKVKGHQESAIGCYINYLEIRNLILLPVFEVDGNKDEEAIRTLCNIFPERIAESININEIAKHGGCLNCITWTIKL